MEKKVYYCDRCKKASIDPDFLGMVSSNIYVVANVKGKQHQETQELGMLCSSCASSLETFRSVLYGGIKMAMRQWFKGEKTC